LAKASHWTLETVRPQLEGEECRGWRSAYAVRRFTEHDHHPVFWGYFPAYDWVAFCWLFGGMNDLTIRVPASLHGRQAMGVWSWAIRICRINWVRASCARRCAVDAGSVDVPREPSSGGGGTGAV